MTKVKTEKYFITTYLSDGIVTNKMEVSKTTFNKQYNDVMRQYYAQEKIVNSKLNKICF